MKIVINHLTRMERGYVCVAGIRASTRSHIRPVTPGRRLPITIADAHGGPFGIRGVVELGDVRECGSPPLVEDVEFKHTQAERIGRLKKSAFWDLLHDVAGVRLKDMFGDDLEQVGSNLAVPIGKGIASLGCLVPAMGPRLWVNGWGKVRLVLDDTEGRYELSVTDLRLHNPEDNTPNQDAVTEMQNRLRDGNSCVLSMGLTKPWTKPGDTQARHWLQVNGIHLEDE
jgi:hypothetical protein